MVSSCSFARASLGRRWVDRQAPWNHSGQAAWNHMLGAVEMVVHGFVIPASSKPENYNNLRKHIRLSLYRFGSPLRLWPLLLTWNDSYSACQVSCPLSGPHLFLLFVSVILCDSVWLVFCLCVCACVCVCVSGGIIPQLFSRSGEDDWWFGRRVDGRSKG